MITFLAAILATSVDLNHDLVCAAQADIQAVNLTLQTPPSPMAARYKAIAAFFEGRLSTTDATKNWEVDARKLGFNLMRAGNPNGAEQLGECVVEFDAKTSF